MSSTKKENWFRPSKNARLYRCPKCGVEGIMDDAFFCKNCGYFEDS